MNKHLKRLIILFPCLLIIFAVTLPTLISQPVIKPYVLSVANAYINGTVTAKKIQASWFDGITLEDVTIRDQKKAPVAIFSKVSSDAPLYSFLYTNQIVGTVQVKAPTLLVTDSKGEVSLDKLLGNKVHQTHFKGLTVKDLSVSVQISGKKKATLALSCRVKGESENDAGSLQIQATTSNLQEFQHGVRDILSRNFKTARLPPATEVTVRIQELPTSLIDTVAARMYPNLKGFVVSGLGKSLSCNFSQTMQNEGISFTFQTQSETLNAKIKGAIENGSIRIPEPASLSYTLLPSFVEDVRALDTRLPNDLTLSKPVTLQAQVVPEIQDKMDEHAAFRFSLRQNTPIVLHSKSFPSPLTTTLEVDGQTPSLKDELSAKLVVAASVNEESLNIKSHLTSQNPLDRDRARTKIDTEIEAKTQIIGAFYTEIKTLLDDLIGENFHLTLQTTTSHDKNDGNWKIHSETMQGEGSFVVTDHVAIAPSRLSYKIARDAAQKFMPQDYTLLSALGGNAAFSSELYFDNLEKSSLDFSFTLDDLALELAEQRLAKFSKTNVLLTKKQDAQNFLQVTSRATLEGQTSIKTDVMLTAEATDLIPKKIKATIGASDLELFYKEQNLGTYALQTPFDIDLAKMSLAAQIFLKTGSQELLSCTLDLAKQDKARFEQFGTYGISSSGVIKKLPVRIFELISGQNELTTLFGEDLTGNWHTQYDPLMQKGEPFTLTLDGENFNLKTKLQVGPKVTGKNAVALSYQLTPDRFVALQKLLKKNISEKKEIALEKPIDISLLCKSVELDLDTLVGQNKPFDFISVLNTTSLECTLSKSDSALRFKEKATGETYPLVLAGSKADIKLSGSEQSIDFKVTSDKKDMPRIDVTGHAKNLWDKNGITLDSATIALDLQAHEIPLEILQLFTENEEAADQVVDLLGKTLNADVKGQVSMLKEGLCSGQVTTEKLSSKVDCSIKDGVLFLNEPIVATYELTEKAGQVLLKDINPLLVSALHTKSPITFRIDNDKFYLPLAPFSLKDMRIKNIVIDPGILTAKNSGILALLAGLLKVKEQEELTLWFTPLYLDVKKGIVRCKRSDILFAQSYPIATWGTIDLIKDTVDMTLGLSGEAVSKAFKVTGLAPEAMIQIPIKGSTKSPKFDTKWALAKITALKLQKHKLNTTSIIGGLLEIAASSQEKEAPKPTTYPFPWQKQ